MSFGHLEEEFKRCLWKYPPDFEKAKELLEQGADINAIEEYSDPETLLSTLILEYPSGSDTCLIPEEKRDSVDCDDCNLREDCRGGRYVPEVVKFFLESGYDVNKNGGYYGAIALYALCYSSYDKYILDAAKILLDAGADPLFEIDEDTTPMNTAGMKASAGIPADESLIQELLFWVLCDILEAKTKNEPYQEIQWYDVVLGRTINRVYSCAASPDDAVCDRSIGKHHYANCFREDIILECEGIPLRVTHYCHAFVNPYGLPSDDKGADMEGFLGQLIGKRIKDIRFSVHKVEHDRVRHAGSMLEILLDDGMAFVVKDNGDMLDDEYCAYFSMNISEIKRN